MPKGRESRVPLRARGAGDRYVALGPTDAAAVGGSRPRSESFEVTGRIANPEGTSKKCPRGVTE